MIADFDQHASKMYRMGRVPNYEPGPQDSLLGEARANGRTALEQAYEAHLMDEGRELVMLPFINYNCGNLDAVHSILSNPHAFPALGDAGAHVGATCDTSYSTFALRYWSQDRRSGPRIPLEQIVHKMTAVTAAHFGLQDRGCLRPGLRADINVIDFENLRLERPYPVDDLPAGGRRFMQDAHGYLATLVAGVPVAEHDRQTGARPGRLLRAPT
jgi:N-acyl-D-aspartate/D-glutamate deacylase